MDKAAWKVIVPAVLLLLGVIPLAGGNVQDGYSENDQITDHFDLIEVDPEGSEILSNVLDRKMGEEIDIKGKQVIQNEEAEFRSPSIIRPHNAELALGNEEPVRASDEEKEQNSGDFPNASYMSTEKETIDGELSYDPAGTSDLRDWYKFDVTDLIETAGSPGGLRNITISLLDITDGLGSYDGLYELSTDINGNLIEDYADLIYISVLYTDPYGGIIDVGGLETSFDDQDDGDGWIFDGDHPDYPNNWTFDFVTGRNSEGAEDTNGWEDGLTEIGWYYIGISFNFFMAEGVTTRDAFNILYSLEIDTSPREDTDSGSNTRETAGTDLPDGDKWIHSAYQPMDWYKLEGSDPSKLWNISVRVNRTGGAAFYNDQGMRYDDWLHVFFVWRDPGEDEAWNTDDDIWRYFHHVLSFFISGGMFIADQNQTVGYYYPSTVLNAQYREAYIGLIAEPASFEVESGQVTNVYYPYWTCYSNYTVDLNVREEEPNNGPSLSDIEISSDWPEEEAGGHFGSMFTFNVTYTDPDNDPPNFLEMVIDPDTFEQITVDMLEHELDPLDNDMTDGKVFSYSVLGEDIGEYYSPHVVVFNTSDKVGITSVRTPRWTGPVYVNDTLYVWDDEPIELSDLYEGLPELIEDNEYQMQSSELEEIFSDPEGNIKSFRIWDGNDWSGDLDTDLLHFNISQGDFGWSALIVPKPNMNGMEMVRIKGADTHSSVVYEGSINIRPVNDPPIIEKVVIGSRNYEVDTVTPYDYRLDLSSSGVKAVEDQLTEMQIIASDQDLPEENVPLDFYFIEGGSDNWDGVVEIDQDTGEITLIPTNEDVKRGRSDMLFEVQDNGGSQNVVEMLISIDLENSQDDPSLQISPNSDLVYEMGDTVDVVLLGSDPDPGDELTYSVNFLDEIGEDHGAVYDQVPFADLEEGVDWGFDENSGRLWWDLSDFRIWQTDDSTIAGTVQIDLVFSATDTADNVVYVEAVLILNEGKAPEVEVDYSYSHGIEDPLTEELESYQYRFTAVEISNQENLDITFKWDFGDGEVKEGYDINHTFETDGQKTVHHWFETEFYSSTKETFTFNIQPVIIDVDDDDDDGGGSSVGLIIGVVATMILLVLIVIILLMMRRKGPEQADEQNEGSEPGELGHRMSSRPLHGDQRENLPPARNGSPSCPRCGASVQQGWYLCPECKNPIE